MDSSTAPNAIDADTIDTADGTEALPSEIWKRILDGLPTNETLPALRSCSLFRDLVEEEAKVRMLCEYLGDYNDTPKDRPLIKQLHDFYLPKPTEQQLRLYAKLREPVWTKLQEQKHPKPQISVPSRIALLLERYDICSVPTSKRLRAIYLYGEDADLEHFLSIEIPIIEPKGCGYLIAAAKPQHYQRVLDKISMCHTNFTFAIELFTDLQRLRDWLSFVLDTMRYNVAYHQSTLISISLVDPENWKSGIQDNNPHVPIGEWTEYGGRIFGMTGSTGPPTYVSADPYPRENRRPDFVNQLWEKLRELFSTATLPVRTNVECTRVETCFLSALLPFAYRVPFEQWTDSKGIKQSLYWSYNNKVRVSGNLELVPILDQLRGTADKVVVPVTQFSLENLYHGKKYELLKRIWIPDYADFHRHFDPSGNLLTSHKEISTVTKKLDPRLLKYYESILEQYPSYFLTELFSKQLLTRRDYLNEITSPKIRWFLGCIAAFMNKLDLLQELITFVELSESQLEQLLQSAKAGQAMTCYHWLRAFIASTPLSAPHSKNSSI